MNKNQIINKIFKRLLKWNLSHEEIINFLSIRFKFNKFEYFIYYLFVIANKQSDDKNHKMANYIKSYITYLIDHYKIQPPQISEIDKQTRLSDLEVFILGISDYEKNYNFYTDLDNNLYISLNKNLEYEQINENTYCIKYQLDSDNRNIKKINLDILSNKINKIYLFKKQDLNNIYLGEFKLIKSDLYNTKYNQELGFIISNINFEFNNEEYEQYKTNITTTIFKNLQNVFNNEIDNKTFTTQIMTSDISTTIINIINYALTNNKQLLNHITNNKINPSLSLFNLTPMKSLLSKYTLSILSNGIDLFCNYKFTIDYLQNIWLVLDDEDLIDLNEIIIDFYTAYDGCYLEPKINKMIFNTTNNPTSIYIFKRTDSGFLFVGYYKLEKFIISNSDNKPYFIIRKMSNNEISNHIAYCLENKIDNSYENIFINLDIDRDEWIRNKNKSIYEQFDVREEFINTKLYKYNWLIKKIINSVSDTKEFNKYFNAYLKFNNNLLEEWMKFETKDLNYLIDNRIIEPFNIAQMMLDKYDNNQMIKDLSFIDYPVNKLQAYDICKKTINNK